MKTIYNALYLSIFLHFLRGILAKFIIRETGRYGLYLDGCVRHGMTFTVLVATHSDMGVIKAMSKYLTMHGWGTTIAMVGSFFAEKNARIIPLGDPALKDLFDGREYKEIAGALNYTSVVDD